MFSRTLRLRIVKSTRQAFSTAIAEKPASAPTAAVKVATPPTPAPKSGGSTFFQRFASFLTGCGVGFGVSFYYIYTELINSNEKFEQELKDLKAQLKGE